ncbi:MAG: hypothetical protein ACPL1A_05075 [Candidatus Kapaibacteriota bacterium]
MDGFFIYSEKNLIIHKSLVMTDWNVSLRGDKFDEAISRGAKRLLRPDKSGLAMTKKILHLNVIFLLFDCYI